LLEVSKHTYIYIGGEIYKFITTNPITDYLSPVGNNDVPYPYAVDTNNNYYLMSEYVILGKISKKYQPDPYEYYYKLMLITPDKGVIPPDKPLIKKYNNIKEFYIGDTRYTLRYEPCPAADFDRLRKTFNGDLYIKKFDNTRYKLTKSAYVKLMNDFGKVINITRMQKVKEITKL